MQPIICRVVSQTEPVSVTTKNGEQLAKSYVRLKGVGGDYDDEFVCSVLGNLAQVKFLEGDNVVASLRFRIFENNGNIYQDVSATNIFKL
ncbi:MAG: hypothetical protein IJ082_02420 [Prevotella sp.]|nr:hypothetical protein [Prevotella sp.]